MFQTLKSYLSKLVAVVVAFFGGFFTGVLREKNKALKEANKGMKDANEIHNRVERDDDYRKRVRDEYR
jgi:hypothetical protein